MSFTLPPLTLHIFPLGVDGVAHGILETQVSTVIASIDCLPLLEKVLRAHAGRHSVRRLIYIDGHQTPDLAGFDLNSSSAAEDEAAATAAANESSVETMALSELEALGKKAIAAGTVRPLFRATPQHLMMIMYTSGTTGTPKAALMTHEQFTTSIKSLYPLVEEAISTAPTHTYISYLPMAHVLELTVESFFYFGAFWDVICGVWVLLTNSFLFFCRRRQNWLRLALYSHRFRAGTGARPKVRHQVAQTDCDHGCPAGAGQVRNEV